MKLAEALAERADLQKRVLQVKSRLQLNAKVQEGELPAEAPVALMEELDTILAQLERLICRINLTNAQVKDEQGNTITQLLAKRECLAMKVEALREFLDKASATVTRNTRSEIKILSTVSVSQCRKTVDDLSKQLRELDTVIQALNWTTQLM